MSNRYEAFSDWLSEQLDLRGWKQADLVRKGVNSGLLSRIISGERKPGPATARLIAKAFDVPEAEVFIHAGLQKKPPQWDSDMEELIEVARGLDKADRDEILAMARLKLHRYRAKNNADAKANKRATAS